MTRQSNKLMSRICRSKWRLAFLVVGLLLISEPAAAQTEAPASSRDRSTEKHTIGLGGQIGTPAGFSLKLRNPEGTSYDFMAAWDSRDFFYINVHALLERQIGSFENANVFFGPGAYIGSRDRIGEEDDDTVAGISATVGLGYLIEQFEMFGQLTPRFDLAPATEGDLGIGVGLRYYF